MGRSTQRNKKVVDTLCGEDKKRTINQLVLVAPMPTNVIEYCRNKGCPLTETDGRVDIYVSEDRVLHAMRSIKPSRLYAQDFDFLAGTIQKGKCTLTLNTKTSFLQHQQKEING